MPAAGCKPAPHSCHNGSLMESTRPAAATASSINEVMTRYRWRICALCFLATTISYVDRQVLGVLAAGGFIDRMGTRIGYAVAIGIWSAATISTSLVRTILGFGTARFFLGLGESGNFPAAIKTVA